MQGKLEIWNFLLSSVKRYEQAILMVVTESEGSSPGRQGFKMAINATKNMMGSIGGGIMEHKLVELALAKLEKRDHRTEIKKQIHQGGIGSNRSGMICSGEQTVAIYPLYREHIPAIEKIIDLLDQEKPCQLDLSPEQFKVLGSSADENRFDFRQGAEHWTYRELLSFHHKAYVIGAGHVGLALTQILHLLGFHVVLVDDRQDLNTMKSNQWADEKVVLAYDAVGDAVSEGPDSYVIVTSFGYRTDEVIVRQLLGKSFAYMGVMGSAHKMKTMWDVLRSDGYSEEQLSQVHTPIGLPISSQTPMEIAISIAAEITQVKNQHHG